jgi:hypothetical protein
VGAVDTRQSRLPAPAMDGVLDRAAAQPCTALGRDQSRIAHLRHHLHVGCEPLDRLEGDQNAVPLVPFTDHLSVPGVTAPPDGR